MSNNIITYVVCPVFSTSHKRSIYYIYIYVRTFTCCMSLQDWDVKPEWFKDVLKVLNKEGSSSTMSVLQICGSHIHNGSSNVQFNCSQR